MAKTKNSKPDAGKKTLAAAPVAPGIDIGIQDGDRRKVHRSARTPQPDRTTPRTARLAELVWGFIGDLSRSRGGRAAAVSARTGSTAAQSRSGL